MLLVAPWRLMNPVEEPPFTPEIGAQLATAGYRDVNRQMGLAALARCDACHGPGDAVGDHPLALAAAPRAVRRDERALGDDVERVRSGGAIYATTCAGCHATPRTGSTRVGTVGVQPQATISASLRSLSEEQGAALLAFLRRHAAALPRPPQRLHTAL
jgi:mono/diheme cytochrome c family protein